MIIYVFLVFCVFILLLILSKSSTSNNERFKNGDTELMEDLHIYKWNSIKLNGHFNGNGHTIYIHETLKNGIFSYISKNSVVENVIIKSVDNGHIRNITGKYISALVGYNDGGIIRNCINNVRAFGYYYTGGICGRSVNGKIINCINNGLIVGDFYTGGICGYSDKSEISKCKNYESCIYGYMFIGGICGYTNKMITDSINAVCINGSRYIGGICGYNKGTISNCYNTGDVHALVSDVGGIVGRNYGNAAKVEKCINEGKISTETDGIIYD